MASALTLYNIEEQLAALADTEELLAPEQEQQFRRDFAAALQSAVAKRDRVGQFLAHADSQIGLANAEIDRLKKRKAAYERVVERVESSIEYTIDSLGRNADGSYKKLEGQTVTFSLKGCPPSVEILDEAAVPDEYKTLAIKLPADLWEDIADLIQTHNPALIMRLQEDLVHSDVSVDKRAIKADLDAGIDVPGADLNIGNRRLERK